MRLPSLVLALLVAGCVGAAEETEPASAPLEPVAAQPVAAPALAAEAPLAEPVTTAFRYEGRTTPGAAVCLPAGNVCQLAMPLAGEQAWTPEHARVVTGLSMTLWWNATTPATATMRLGASYGAEGSREHPFVDGQSPLALAVEGIRVMPEHDLEVWGFAPSVAGSEAVWLLGDQPFALDVLVTYAPE